MALRVVPVVSDLQLQKCLYFSIWSGLWFGAVEIALCVFKLTQLDVSHRREDSIVLPVLVSIWSVLELFRIRLGYIGNLGEKVPETSAFWLLTLLPQLPLAVYLGFAQGMLTPLDYGAAIPHVALTCMHLHYGLRAVRSFIRKQTRDFYRLCQEEALAAVAATQKRPSGGAVRERPGVLLGPDGRVLPGQAALSGGISGQGGSSEEGTAGTVPFSPVQASSLATPAVGSGPVGTTFSPATDLSFAYAARMASAGQPLPMATSGSAGAGTDGAQTPASSPVPVPVGGGIGNIAAEGARFIVKAGLSAVTRAKGAAASTIGGAQGEGKAKSAKSKAKAEAGAAAAAAGGTGSADSAKRR